MKIEYKEAIKKLDYEEKSTEKRLKIVEGILKEYDNFLDRNRISEEQKNKILKKFGDYLDYNKKTKQSKFEKKDIINNYLVAGGSDGLRHDGEAQGKIDKQVFFKANTEIEFRENYKKGIKQKIFPEDIKKSDLLKEYKENNEKLKNLIGNNNKDTYSLIKFIKTLYDDMIFIKIFENGTIYFKNILPDNGSTNSSIFEIDFFDQNHYDTILKILPFKDLSQNLKKIYETFEKLEKYLDISEDKRKMLEVLKKGKITKLDKLFFISNNRRELLQENKKAVYDLKSLKNKLGWKYEATKKTYYRLQNDCFEAFLKYYENEIYYLYLVKGKYKQCSNCGEIKLVKEYNKHPNTKDGLENICRDCKSKYNNERINNII